MVGLLVIFEWIIFRCKKDQKFFDFFELDRFYCIVRIFVYILDVFENVEIVRDWLKKLNCVLVGKIFIELLDIDVGI